MIGAHNYGFDARTSVLASYWLGNNNNVQGAGNLSTQKQMAGWLSGLTDGGDPLSSFSNLRTKMEVQVYYRVNSVQRFLKTDEGFTGQIFVGIVGNRRVIFPRTDNWTVWLNE